MNPAYVELVKRLDTSEAPEEILKEMIPEWFGILEQRIPPNASQDPGPSGEPRLMDIVEAKRTFAKIIHNASMQYLGWMVSGDKRLQSYMTAMQITSIAFRDAEFFWAGVSREQMMQQMQEPATQTDLARSPGADAPAGGEVELIVPEDQAPEQDDNIVSPE